MRNQLFLMVRLWKEIKLNCTKNMSMWGDFFCKMNLFYTIIGCFSLKSCPIKILKLSSVSWCRNFLGHLGSFWDIYELSGTSTNFLLKNVSCYAVNFSFRIWSTVDWTATPTHCGCFQVRFTKTILIYINS